MAIVIAAPCTSMPVHHLQVVHLVDVIAGKNENLPRILHLDAFKILINSISRPQIPIFMHALHWRNGLQ